MPSKKKLIEQRKKFEAEKKKNEEMQVKLKKDKHDISKLVSEVDMLLDKNILFGNQNSELTNDLKELKEKTASLQNQHDLLLINHKELQENYDSCFLRLKELQEKYDILLSKNNEDTIVIENNKVEIESLQARLLVLKSSESIIEDLNQNVKTLNSQLENERQTYKNELEKVTESHDNQVALINQAHADKVEAIQKDQENHVALLKETHKIEVEKIISEKHENEKLLKEHHKKDVDELTKAKQDQEISLKLAHKNDVEELTKALKDTETSLKMVHKEEVESLKKELVDQEVLLKNAHESEVNILKKELVDQEVILKNAHESEVNILKKELVDQEVILKHAHELEVNKFKNELKDQEVFLKTSHEKEVGNLKNELKELNTVLEQSHEKYVENLKYELENQEFMLQKEHTKNVESLTKNYEDKIFLLESNLEEYKVKINNISKEVEALENDLNETNKKLSTTNDLLNDTRNTLNKQNANVISLEAERIELKEEIVILHGIHEEKSNLILNLQDKLSEVEILLLEEKELCHKQEKQIEEYKVLENEKEIIEGQLVDIKNELDCTKTELGKTIELLESTKCTSDERYSQIIEMGLEISKLNNEVTALSISKRENEDIINGLRNQLLKETSLLLKEHDLRMKQEKELEQLVTVKEEKKNMEEEMYHMKKQFEMKNLKLKLLRNKIQSTSNQKEKAESFLFLLPEMQKKIEFLDKENQKLEKNIEEQAQKEKEKLAMIAFEKQEEEEKLKLQKEDWEKRMLGIGRCIHSEFDNALNFKNRPKSAPSMKPKPPTTSRRYMNGVRKHKAPTLNPSFLQASIDTNWQSINLPVLKNNLFKESFSSTSHLSTRQLNPTEAFQQIIRDKNIVQPRILMLENEEVTSGKRLLAMGDKVYAKLKCNCSLHNGFEEHIGTVAFIGFVDGNDVDVYVGLVMDDDVGNTDGKINGKRYFRCEAQKGRFVRFNDIRKYNDISYVEPVFPNAS